MQWSTYASWLVDFMKWSGRTTEEWWITSTKKGGTYSQTICIWIREMLTVCQSELIKQKQTARKRMQFRGKVQPNARRLFMVFTTPKKGENQMKTRYFWIEILKALKINILVKRFSSNITYSEFSKIRLAGVSYSLFIEL